MCGYNLRILELVVLPGLVAPLSKGHSGLKSKLVENESLEEGKEGGR